LHDEIVFYRIVPETKVAISKMLPSTFLNVKCRAKFNNFERGLIMDKHYHLDRVNIKKRN
jgi:hypothetical protein